MVSSITYGEILTLNTGKSVKELDLGLFYASLNHLTTVAADDLLCQVAGELRRQYGLKLPDAIHLATARSQVADLFVTNDGRLAKIASSLMPTKTLKE